MEGYQVSNQCQALVRDECLVPTKDAPELAYARQSSSQTYIPDVYYKVSQFNSIIILNLNYLRNNPSEKKWGGDFARWACIAAFSSSIFFLVFCLQSTVLIHFNLRSRVTYKNEIHHIIIS